MKYISDWCKCQQKEDEVCEKCDLIEVVPSTIVFLMIKMRFFVTLSLTVTVYWLILTRLNFIDDFIDAIALEHDVIRVIEKYGVTQANKK